MLDDPEQASRQWWDRVCSSALQHPIGPRSIAELAEQFGNVPMLVVMSADYLTAIRDDLRRAVSLPYFKTHLSIISSGTPSDHPLWQDHLLPSGADLAGSVGGTGDWPVRNLMASKAPGHKQNATAYRITSKWPRVRTKQVWPNLLFGGDRRTETRV
jgi:hypothetical protein